MADVEKVSKGGECLFELSIDRKASGVEVWVRADPRVEEFMKSIPPEDAPAIDLLESITKNWVSVGAPLSLYNLGRDLDTAHYTFSSVGGSMTGYKQPGNIAFLRFVGAGSPEGVRFMITGPISRDHIRTFKDAILNASRQFLRDFIVPVYINLRVTSTEL